MALINHATRELTAKIVYYGPGLCGKTTNLKYIYECLDDDQRGPMLSLATEADRTLFFDFLPLEVGTVKGFRVRVQLYTVPGQVFYEETRRRVLKGADGVVFVADSQRSMADSNKESFRQLIKHLADNHLDPDDMPIVLQYNKRDLEDILTLEEMDRDLNAGPRPFFEAVASEGIGVEDTFAAITRLVLKKLVSTGIEEPSRIKQETHTAGRASPRANEPPPAARQGLPSPPKGEKKEPLPLTGLLSESHPLFAGQGEDEVLDLFGEEEDLAEVLEDDPSDLELAEVIEEVEEEAADSRAPPRDGKTCEPVILNVGDGGTQTVIVEIGGRRYKMSIRFEPLD